VIRHEARTLHKKKPASRQVLKGCYYMILIFGGPPVSRTQHQRIMSPLL